ncbi:MAG TPA: hypothetical protein VI942_10220, partial [Thermoanaerobaculia bacterium]|nr:hypothetical protein [Thermoanaerobaculia bacterium]
HPAGCCPEWRRRIKAKSIRQIRQRARQQEDATSKRRSPWLDLDRDRDPLSLENGNRVAVVGGGPAGALFATFLRQLAELVGLDVAVDVFEPRRFDRAGPAGCNHCGGVVSESLVQMLAAEGIEIPAGIIQRGIDSYVLHLDVGTVRIDPPGREKRIAAVYRGNGPRDGRIGDAVGFDRYLLELAAERGARVEPRLVTDLGWSAGRPRVVCGDGFAADYDLLVLASGVNSNLLAAAERLGVGFRAPASVRTFITEFHLGREAVERALGASMHVFLLDLPNLEFGALIPKGDFVTACLLGRRIDDDLVRSFLAAPEVRSCFPGGVLPPACCHCFPRINVGPRGPAWGDRVVMIGDSGVTRLYKDGIGAAYRTAKSAATTAVLQGVSAKSFARHYGGACRRIDRDNAIGKFLFACGHAVQHARFSRRVLLRMTRAEQSAARSPRLLSSILWDLFTGSSSYRDILERGLRPSFAGGLLRHAVAGGWRDPAPAAAIPAGRSSHA